MKEYAILIFELAVQSLIQGIIATMPQLQSWKNRANSQLEPSEDNHAYIP